MIEVRPGVWVDSVSKDWQLRIELGNIPLPNAVVVNGQLYEKKK